MDPRCDYCDTYQRLGYDRCPACQPTEDPPHAAPSPLLLIDDLCDQLTRYTHSGLSAGPVAIAGWLQLATRLKAVTQHKEHV